MLTEQMHEQVIYEATRTASTIAINQGLNPVEAAVAVVTAALAAAEKLGAS
ncbi:hypothetical protein B0G74_7889 [Paraburkholderia sp. BL9I2N2]|nr:hypothetical protein B0G74_7889 [Paraburkholderia sp. BL9I2N2]